MAAGYELRGRLESLGGGPENLPRGASEEFELQIPPEEQAEYFRDRYSYLGESWTKNSVLLMKFRSLSCAHP
jgi:hypothetical protein